MLNARVPALVLHDLVFFLSFFSLAGNVSIFTRDRFSFVVEFNSVSLSVSLCSRQQLSSLLSAKQMVGTADDANAFHDFPFRVCARVCTVFFGYKSPSLFVCCVAQCWRALSRHVVECEALLCVFAWEISIPFTANLRVSSFPLSLPQLLSVSMCVRTRVVDSSTPKITMRFGEHYDDWMNFVLFHFYWFEAIAFRKLTHQWDWMIVKIRKIHFNSTVHTLVRLSLRKTKWHFRFLFYSFFVWLVCENAIQSRAKYFLFFPALLKFYSIFSWSTARGYNYSMYKSYQS